MPERLTTTGGAPKERTMSDESKCPFSSGASKSTMAGTRTNADWWPNQLNLKTLHQHSPLANPMGEAFNYAEEFKSLDLDAVIEDLHALMTTRRTGGPRTTATMGRSSSAWRGTAQAPIVSPMAAAARARERSDLLPSTAGRTT